MRAPGTSKARERPGSCPEGVTIWVSETKTTPEIRESLFSSTSVCTWGVVKGTQVTLADHIGNQNQMAAPSPCRSHRGGPQAAVCGGGLTPSLPLPPAGTPQGKCHLPTSPQDFGRDSPGRGSAELRPATLSGCLQSSSLQPTLCLRWEGHLWTLRMKRPLGFGLCFGFFFNWKLKFLRRHPLPQGNEPSCQFTASRGRLPLEQHFGVSENTTRFSLLVTWLLSSRLTTNTGAYSSYTCDTAGPPSSTQRRIWDQHTDLKTLNFIYFARLESFNDNLLLLV